MVPMGLLWVRRARRGRGRGRVGVAVVGRDEEQGDEVAPVASRRAIRSKGCATVTGGRECECDAPCMMRGIMRARQDADVDDAARVRNGLDEGWLWRGRWLAAMSRRC